MAGSVKAGYLLWTNAYRTAGSRTHSNGFSRMNGSRNQRGRPIAPGGPIHRTRSGRRHPHTLLRTKRRGRGPGGLDTTCPGRLPLGPPGCGNPRGDWSRTRQAAQRLGLGTRQLLRSRRSPTPRWRLSGSRPGLGLPLRSRTPASPRVPLPWWSRVWPPRCSLSRRHPSVSGPRILAPLIVCRRLHRERCGPFGTAWTTGSWCPPPRAHQPLAQAPRTSPRGGPIRHLPPAPAMEMQPGNGSPAERMPPPPPFRRFRAMSPPWTWRC